MARHRLSNLNTEELTAQCSVCGLTKMKRSQITPRVLFRCVASGADEFSSGLRRSMKMMGITAAMAREIPAFKARKTGACEICGALGAVTRLCIDHNHRTLKLRGVLCVLCNRGLGYFMDDPAIMLAASSYLARQ